MNQVILIGRTGKDPEFKTVGNKNTALATLSMATSKNIGNFQNPNWVSTWHNLKFWGKSAEYVRDNIRKGDEIFVQGEIEVESWDGKDGQKQYRTMINVAVVRITKVNEQGQQQGSGGGEQYNQGGNGGW